MDSDEEPCLESFVRKTPKYIKYPGLLDPEFADRDFHELPPKKCEPSQCLIHGKRFPCGIKDLRDDASPPVNRTPNDPFREARAPYPPPKPLDFLNLSQASSDILLKQTELLDLLTMSYCASDVQNLIMRMKRKVKWLFLDLGKREIYIKEDGCTCWIEKRVLVSYGDNHGCGYVGGQNVVRLEALTAQVFSETPLLLPMIHRIMNLFDVPNVYLKVDWTCMSSLSPWAQEDNWPFTDLLIIGDGDCHPGIGCMALLKRRKIWKNLIFEGVHFQKTFRENDDVIGGFLRQFLEDEIENIIFRDCAVTLESLNCFVKLWMQSKNTVLKKLTITFVTGKRCLTPVNLLKGLTPSRNRLAISRENGEFKYNDQTLKSLRACHLTRDDGFKSSIVVSEIYNNRKTVTFLVHGRDVEDGDCSSSSGSGSGSAAEPLANSGSSSGSEPLSNPDPDAN